MKFNKWILALVALGTLLCASARADIYSYKAIQFTNSAASSTNGPFFNNTSTNLTALTATAASLTINSDPINLGSHRGFTLFTPLVSNTNSATGNVTNRYDYSYVIGSTTVWTTTHPLKTVTPLNGTNPVVDVLVVDKSTADNVNAIRWYDTTVAAQAGITNVVTVSQPVLNYTLYAP